MDGHIELVKLLLTHGAKADQAANNGYTPLSVSRLNGHQEVVDLLLASVAQREQAEKAAEVKAAKGELKRAARVCENCGKEAAKMKKCSVCKLVRYCSEECQLKDWKEHKKSCKEVAARKKEGGKGG